MASISLVGTDFFAINTHNIFMEEKASKPLRSRVRDLYFVLIGASSFKLILLHSLRRETCDLSSQYGSGICFNDHPTKPRIAEEAYCFLLAVSTHFKLEFHYAPLSFLEAERQVSLQR
jgi:hypothetical protein